MLLEAHGICKSFGTADQRFDALTDVSVGVDAGECVGIIGESGCGKSTLARILIGLDAADTGTVRFQGYEADASVRPPRRPAEVRAAFLDMQMVFQNPQNTFSDRMRVGEGVEEGIAYRRGYQKGEGRRLVLETLEMVGLPASYARKYAWELSGGECQRAAIARAILSKPKLLICDEPTSALDVTVQAQIINLLIGLCRELRMACLFISHDLVLVQGFCERLYVMGRGRVVEEGQTADIFAHPQDEHSVRLLSSVLSL